jgi:hypothetical protein
MTRAIELAISCCLLGACAGSVPEPVAAERQRAQLEAQSFRLLQPLCDDSKLACGELVVEISPNFFGNVSQPALMRGLQTERKSQEDGYDQIVWTNPTGSLDGAIEITIGAADEFTEKGPARGKGTQFTALRRVILRIRTGRRIEPSLVVSATGQPMVRATKAGVADLSFYELRDGVLTMR